MQLCTIASKTFHAPHIGSKEHSMSDEENYSVVTALWQQMTSASLGTLDVEGVPYVSLVTICPYELSAASLLLSKLARHTTNLQRDERCSLLIVDEPQDDVLASNRITASGTLRLADVKDTLPMRDGFLRAHPQAADYVDFTDFSFYRFEPVQFHLVGGFGRIETIPAVQLFAG